MSVTSNCEASSHHLTKYSALSTKDINPNIYAAVEIQDSIHKMYY